MVVKCVCFQYTYGPADVDEIGYFLDLVQILTSHDDSSELMK